MSLVPCPSCNRHIRTGERACPFCGASISASLASKAIPGATQRMSRAAAFAFTATLTMANCGPGTTPAPTPDAAADADDMEVSVMPLYGSPVDASPDTTPPPDATADVVNDNGGPMPLYGAPADAGPAPDVEGRDGAVRDNGGVVPLYGAVPAPDAGDQDAGDGSIGVRYGGPPRDA